jgi:hypothetical protein
MPYQSSFTFINELYEALPKVLTKDCIKAWHCTGKLKAYNLSYESYFTYAICTLCKAVKAYITAPLNISLIVH